MSEIFKIIPMTDEHVPLVGRLESITFYDAWSESAIRGSLTADHCFCAFSDSGELVGYVMASSIFEDGEILRIAVHPLFKKKGLASLLLKTLFQKCKTLGVQDWFLEVRAGNIAAISLYKKLGFIPLGRRRNYYSTPNGKEDALTMHMKF